MNYTSSSGNSSMNSAQMSIVAQVKGNADNAGRSFSFSSFNYTNSQSSNGNGRSILTSSIENNVAASEKNSLDFNGNKGFGLADDDGPGKGKSKTSSKSILTQSSDYETAWENGMHKFITRYQGAFKQVGLSLLEEAAFWGVKIEFVVPLMIEGLEEIIT